jgi:putative ABC transport system substrate-binding protein
MTSARNLRREFLRALACIACIAPSVARAQAGGAKYRIGYLHPASGQDAAYPALRQALEALGYTFGQNIEFETRFAHGRPGNLPGFAVDLVALKVDVIVAVSPTAIRAALGATKTIPIVMAFSGDDPVKSGFAKSLARPGGNVTGMTSVAHDFAPKWIELLREAVPAAKRIAVLRISGRHDHTDQVDAMRTAAERHDAHLQVVELREVAQLDQAFAAMTAERADAVVVLSSPELTVQRQAIADLCLRHRLPSIFQFREFVAAGGLLSYGPDIADLSTRAAAFVDKILKGASPGDLAIEQPTKFVLSVNSQTAARLNLSLPKSLLLRADERV